MTISIGSTAAVRTSAAERQAQQNWQANLPALEEIQPQLADGIRNTPVPLEWTYARDGCLSAIDSTGQWIGNCSLPRRASEQMLRTVQTTGHTCFAFPLHPVQIAVVLGILSPNQTVHAVVPDMEWLAVALRCCDFSAAMRTHRLFFAAGANWAEELARTLREHPGLPIPQNLVHTITVKDDQAAAFVAVAQRVFSQISGERNRIRAEILTKAPGHPGATKRACLLAPSRFRLWEDGPAILAQTLRSSTSAAGTPLPPWEYSPLDPDDPAASSHLAVAMACQNCQAIIAANCTRADLAEVIPGSIPMISWLTAGPIPPFTAAMAEDALLLADAAWVQRARSAGWPASRLAVATWPVSNVPALAASSAPYLAIIADTTDARQLPPSVDLSSHGLLWDLINEEMRKDPFVLNGDLQQYLASRMRRLGIDEQGFDRRVFLENLIVPAYQQGLARLLLEAGLPVRLFGRTWASLPEFTPYAQGPVNSRAELITAAAGACGLIHVWPTTQAHPIDALRRPVLRSYSTLRSAFLQSARRLLTSPVEPSAAANPLTAELIVSLLPR
ncbi:MAG: hypothetical protein ACM359_00710 [Bacillota bacterium]